MRPLKKQYFSLLLLVLFLMIPSLLLVFIGEDSVIGSFIKKGVFLLISFSMIIVFLALLKPKYFSYFTITRL